MASPFKRCRTCGQFCPIAGLNAHRVLVHKAVECKICDKVFATQHRLECHLRASPAKHREGHTARCSRPNCDPRSCPTAYTGDFGNSVSSSSSLSVVITSSPTPAAQPLVIRAAPLVRVTIRAPSPSRSDNDKFYCDICTKDFSSRDSLESHMRASVDHHILHDRYCRRINCNPRKCFQRLASSPAADSEQSPTTKIGASTKPAVRRIVETGPPDPVPTGPPTASSFQPGPTLASGHPSSTNAQPKPKKKKKRTKRKTAPPAHTSSNGDLDVSDGDFPSSWRSYVVQRASMIGRQLDLDGEVEYDSTGEGWCIFCHGPSSGRWDHSCPGYSD